MRANLAKMHSGSSGEQLLELCTCPSGHNCDGCKSDDQIRAKSKGDPKSRSFFGNSASLSAKIKHFETFFSNKAKSQKVAQKIFMTF